MGLIKVMELSSGVNLERAYLMVNSVGGTKQEQTIILLTFASKEAREQGKEPLEQKYYTFIPSIVDDSPNYHKQAYEYLKTIPDFEDATDA